MKNHRRFEHTVAAFLLLMLGLQVGCGADSDSVVDNGNQSKTGSDPTNQPSETDSSSSSNSDNSNSNDATTVPANSIISRSMQGAVIAFSNDGKRLVCTGVDESIALWDVESKQFLGTLEGHSDFVRTAAFSPNGKQLASGGDDGTVRLWDLVSKKEKATLNPGIPISCLAFSPDGEQVIVGGGREGRGSSGYLALWKLGSSAQLVGNFTGHTAKVNAIAFAPDGKTFASSSGWPGLGVSGIVAVWNIESRSVISVHKPYAHGVTTIRFSDDGNLLAVGCVRIEVVDPIAKAVNGVQLIDVSTGRHLAFAPVGDHEIRSVRFFDNDQKLVVSDDHNQMKIVDVKDGKSILSLAEQQSKVAYVDVSPDRTSLASVDVGGDIRIWPIGDTSNLPQLTAEATLRLPADSTMGIPQVKVVLKDASLILNFEKDSFIRTASKVRVKNLSNQRSDGFINGATGFVKGKAGLGLLFDGHRDYVEFPALRAQLSRQLKAISILGWVRYAPSEDVKIVFDVGLATLESISVFIKNKGIIFALPTDHGGKSLFSGVINNSNQWHHFSAVWDGEEQKIYINGTLRGRVKTESLILNESTVHDFPARIGIHSKEGNNLHKRDFEGGLDEFVIFTRALSEAEIAIIYQAGQKGRPLTAPK